MRVLITGSRSWTDREKIRAELEALPSDATIVHGHCKSGADAIADAIAHELRLKVERHPADWNKYGKSAGPIRNTEMVNTKPDLCIAFRMPGVSNGTDDCVRKAKAAGIPGKTVVP
jgi:hypothetical protein